MDSIKVAVVGCGYWGPNLIRNFSSCPSTVVTAVCDADPQRLEAVSKANPHLKACLSLDEVLSFGVQAVAIATPVSTHFPLAARCLQEGLHVLIEKPLAATVAEARA